MLHHVTINIDGADIRAAKGTSVLEVAIEYGICIPHLCHVPTLSDIGAIKSYHLLHPYRTGGHGDQ
jgi:predicted molibdopterin-dependent oxidoreductase YjgC